MRFHYLLRRLAVAAALVLTVSSGSLWIVRLAPGDFVTQSLGTMADSAEAATMRTRLGLDRAVSHQYGEWLLNLARLELGVSFVDARPVAALVLERGFNTGLLAVASLALATVIGVTLGTINGSRASGWTDWLVSQVSIALLSLPPLLTSLLLAVVAAHTRWLPVSGMHSPGATGVLDVAWHMVVPVLALALPVAASFERIQANAIRQTLRQPFVVAARARGLGGAQLLWQAVLRPSLTSIASVYGVAAAALFSGSLAVEVVTAWPGLGRLTMDALRLRDVYVVAGCALAGSIGLALTTLCADVALVTVDPRAAD